MNFTMPHRRCLAGLLLSAAVLLAGCDLLAVKGQLEESNALCRLSGTVKLSEPEGRDFVVVLFRHQSGPIDRYENWTLVDHFVTEHPGRWFFYVTPGTYLATAFEDTNRDRVFSPDEPALRPNVRGNVIQCRPGEAKGNLDLVIPSKGRITGRGSLDLTQLEARSSADQLHVAMGQALTVGEVTDLGDARFSRENANKGLWRPFDFLWDVKPGIFFLEPYDPAKTPVLFEHGVNGTPIDFTYLIKHLDRQQFQPWVFYYPTGGYLQRLGAYLNQIVAKLREKHGFHKLIVIAHSMGGLVSREFMLRNAEDSPDDFIPLFVSLATPWGGHAAARIGVDYTPTTPVQVWYDLSPGSKFLTGLFYTNPEKPSNRRRLPRTIAHHLIFGFLPSESGDGTIPLESQLRWEAQQESARLYGLQQSHTDVLLAPEASKLLNAILANARRAAPGGQALFPFKP